MDIGKGRERWGTRIGLVLAAAGNAVGIGNLLRFPSQAAQQGGGAFIIPYIVSLFVFGIPMMWLIWWIGRYGGRFGHGSTPGMFDKIVPGTRFVKYLGVMGVAFPLIFCIYYTYIESWMLGYSWLSLTGHYKNVIDYGQYLAEYNRSSGVGNYFPTATLTLVAFAITIGINIFVLACGISKGIEALAKIAMPLLFIFCIILAVRVLSIGQGPGGHVLEGLSYVWNPDFSKILSASVWLAAAGQIFFTLSIGFGSLECYASYLKEEEDVVLTGLTTMGTNELVEVIFGSIIAIPATAAFLGTKVIPEFGAFAIGVIAMPQIMLGIQPVELFGTMWFLLLFFAAFTSSVAVSQPIMAFLQDELRLRRIHAALILGCLWAAGTLLLISFMKYGMLDQFDFWAGTVVLVVFCLIEVILVCWIFGINRFWQDIHRGADIRIPGIFYYVLKYVTPVALIAILGGWLYEEITKKEMQRLDPKSKVTETQADIERIRAKVDLVRWFRDKALEEEIEAKRDIIEALKEEGRYKQAEQESKELEELQKQLKKEKERFVRPLIEMAETRGKDVSVIADVSLDEGGRVTGVTKVEAHSEEAFELVKRLIEPRRYKVTKYHKDRRQIDTEWRGPITFRIVVEAIYVKPATWLARGAMLCSLLLFCILISIAWSWKKRGA
jgi:SNF family Na+-dependent transporter